MTSEQLLLSAVTALTSALCFVVKELWRRSNQCERDRIALRQEIEDVKTSNGEMHGFLEGVKRCPVEGCGFREGHPARHTQRGPSALSAKPLPS